MFSAESLGFLGDELDCREFVVEQFQCGILAQVFSFFYINEYVDTVNGLQHKANSSTQVFLQYICNWCEDATLCASPHWRLNR